MISVSPVAESTEEFRPVEGRSVVLRISEFEWRPAQIVRVWSPTTCNLVVFLDGPNDQEYVKDSRTGLTKISAEFTVAWATSRSMGANIGQWLARKPVDY